MKKGFFITFEGADGCGKTTQLELVADYFLKNGIDYIKTREPGATDLGKKLREILLHYDGKVADMCEVFLYLADRAQHIKSLVEPALNDGKIILCDRHTDSFLAYQGYARGGDIKQIKYLNNIATSGIIPDLTIVFDVDSVVAQGRVGNVKDRLENEGLEFHKKVRNGYLQIAENEPNRVKVIDANRDIACVFEDTKKIISELINL